MNPAPDSQLPTRRSVLKRGVIGGALLTLGGAGVLASQKSRLVPPPKEGLRTLSAREFAVVHALAARLIPPMEGKPSVEDLHVAEAFDRILAATEASVQKELKQLIGLFENALAGFLFNGHLRPFTQMTPAEQDRVLDEWQTSRITLRRTGLVALRGIVMAAFYGSPLSWAAVGYGGPPEGFNQPDAPVWRGVGPRPDGNGVWHDGERP